MKKILIVISLITNVSVFSQTELQKKTDVNSLSLKLNSTALIDNLSFPTYEVAIEKKFANFYSVQLETGIQLYQLQEKQPIHQILKQQDID